MHTVLAVGGFATLVGIIKVSNSFPEVRKKLVQDNIVAITKYIFQVACLNLLYATNSAIKPTGNSQSDQQYVVVFFFFLISTFSAGLLGTHKLNDYFSAGLIAQLVEHCSRSTEAIVSNPERINLRLNFQALLSL